MSRASVGISFLSCCRQFTDLLASVGGKREEWGARRGGRRVNGFMRFLKNQPTWSCDMLRVGSNDLAKKNVDPQCDDSDIAPPPTTTITAVCHHLCFRLPLVHISYLYFTNDIFQWHMAPPTPRNATASSTALAAGIGLGDDDKKGCFFFSPWF